MSLQTLSYADSPSSVFGTESSNFVSVLVLLDKGLVRIVLLISC